VALAGRPYEQGFLRRAEPYEEVAPRVVRIESA
jgi:hypothetical protein